MENMIKKIIDADNKAKEIEAQTLQEKETLSEEIENEAKKIYSDYMAKAEEVVKRNDRQEEQNAKSQWDKFENKQKSVLIKLKSDYERNAEKWVNAIVKRTIG